MNPCVLAANDSSVLFWQGSYQPGQSQAILCDHRMHALRGCPLHQGLPHIGHLQGDFEPHHPGQEGEVHRLQGLSLGLPLWRPELRRRGEAGVVRSLFGQAQGGEESGLRGKLSGHGHHDRNPGRDRRAPGKEGRRSNRERPPRLV